MSKGRNAKKEKKKKPGDFSAKKQKNKERRERHVAYLLGNPPKPEEPTK